MGKARQWKNGGPEDTMLNKLMKQGKVNKFSKPADLQKTIPEVFGSFTSQVIRNHLNMNKRVNGLYLDGHSESDEDKEPNNDVEQTPESSSRPSDDVKMDSTGANTSHLNYPSLTKEFECPDTGKQKVLTVVTLPGGVKYLTVELNDAGTTFFVKYIRPKTTFTVNDLFKTRLDNGEFTTYHPMLACFKSALAGVRKRIDLAPDGAIKVALPFKVQTTVDSWTKWGVKRDDGSQVLVAVFSGYEKEYVKKAADERVTTIFVNKVCCNLTQ